MFPQAVWVTGEGPYASLAWCRVLSVMLFSDLDQAEDAKAFIDRLACGGACHGDHEIVLLEMSG